MLKQQLQSSNNKVGIINRIHFIIIFSYLYFQSFEKEHQSCTHLKERELIDTQQQLRQKVSFKICDQ